MSGDDCERKKMFEISPAILRYRFVVDFIKEINEKNVPAGLIQKVIDLGCSKGQLLPYLKPIQSIKMIFALDKCEYALYNARENARPSLVDQWNERSSNQVINLFQGSMCEHDRRFASGDIDLVACIEAIEHIELKEVPGLTENIFGHIRPRYAIVSTPNFEYNQVMKEAHKKTIQYQMFGGDDDDDDDVDDVDVVDDLRIAMRTPYRDLDHRFEWTRAEFAKWCDNVVASYNYDYHLDGLGLVQGDDGARAGHCTQIAIFTRRETSQSKPTEAIDEYDIYEKPKMEKRYQHYASYTLWKDTEYADLF